MHFYRLHKGEWRLSKSIDTVAKARKSPHAYCASVTTKLALAPNPFITQWRERQLIELARANPSDTYERLSEKAWGLRECPETGELIPSSEWGTRLHDAIESANLDIIQEDGSATDKKHLPYEEWVNLWIKWLDENNVEILEAELLIGCLNRRLAGMLDAVIRIDGKVALADYKSRKVGDGDIKTKAYEKDAMQLAIEAQMIKEQWNLGYDPKIYTVIFDTDTPRMHVKLWTKAAQAKALGKAERINMAFNLIEQL